MKIKSIAISLILSTFIFTGCATKSTTQDTGLKKITPQQENSKIESLYEKERKEFLSETMHSPKIPVKTPDKILRVLSNNDKKITYCSPFLLFDRRFQ